jgi:C1A family cysteine protease
LALVATALSANIHPQFLEFVGRYNKVYNNDAEFLKRMEIFKNNMALAAEWSHQGTARFGATEYADMTPQEFAEQRLMTDLPPYERLGEEFVPNPNAPAAPRQFDWRDQGAVSPVKNQAQCGSCWAFSATENLESVNFLKTKTLPIAAPQQIVDCDKDWYGCSGGWPYGAFTYLKNFGGQDSEASYPYKAVDGTCVANTANIVAKLTGYKDVGKDEGSVFAAIATAPLSICVDASRWYLYQSGVISASQCGQSIDHCVQLIGYDQDTAGGGAWLVRNSWGTSWGENGLLRLQMGQDTCAMNDAVTTATL